MPRSVLLNFFGIVTGGIIYSYYSYYGEVLPCGVRFAVIENVFTSTFPLDNRNQENPVVIAFSLTETLLGLIHY